MFVISCHADTGFENHRLGLLPGGWVQGHLDNFAGVYAVMRAFFSGGLDCEHVRVELTHGEEAGLLGATELLAKLSPNDLVAVVDVTGTSTRKDFVIEKCAHPDVKRFLGACLKGMSYDLYEGCPDPISDMDECNVYIRKCPFTFFVGVPCVGGDYNRGVVRCRTRSLQAVSRAIVSMAGAFPKFRRS